jgi:hypothetical protein
MIKIATVAKSWHSLLLTGLRDVAQRTSKNRFPCSCVPTPATAAAQTKLIPDVPVQLLTSAALPLIKATMIYAASKTWGGVYTTQHPSNRWWRLKTLD